MMGETMFLKAPKDGLGIDTEMRRKGFEPL